MTNAGSERRFIITIWDKQHKPNYGDAFHMEYESKVRAYHEYEIINSPLLSSVIVQMLRDANLSGTFTAIEFETNSDAVKARLQLLETANQTTAPISVELEQKLIHMVIDLQGLQLPLFDIEKSLTRLSYLRNRISNSLNEFSDYFQDISKETAAYRDVAVNRIIREEQKAISSIVSHNSAIRNAIAEYVDIVFPVVFWGKPASDPRKSTIIQSMEHRLIPNSIRLRISSTARGALLAH